jgi:hypothetical protein
MILAWWEGSSSDDIITLKYEKYSYTYSKNNELVRSIIEKDLHIEELIERRDWEDNFRKDLNMLLWKEVKKKMLIEDMLSTEEEVRRELTLEIEGNEIIEEKTEKVETFELKKLTEEELTHYANVIEYLDDYWRGFEIGRWINEHPKCNKLINLLINRKEIKMMTLEEKYNKGEINQGTYINLYLQRCKEQNSGVMIKDLEQMLKNIDIPSPGEKVLKQWLKENNFQ